MHQVAHHYVNGSVSDNSAPATIGVFLLVTNSLDAELLSSSLHGREAIQVFAASEDPDFCLARCQRVRPQILIVDPNVADDVVARAFKLVRRDELGHLLILDDRFREGRVASLLAMPAVSYVTRQAGIDELVACIQKIAATNARSFDSQTESRLQRNGTSLQLQPPENRRSITVLTGRELQVMTLLASGYSVRRCAEKLGLAESTIDNHKSRLMKKLDVHKIVELAHLAIREGLIVV